MAMTLQGENQQPMRGQLWDILTNGSKALQRCNNCYILCERHNSDLSVIQVIQSYPKDQIWAASMRNWNIAMIENDRKEGEECKTRGSNHRKKRLRHTFLVTYQGVPQTSKKAHWDLIGGNWCENLTWMLPVDHFWSLLPNTNTSSRCNKIHLLIQSISKGI